MDEQIIIRKSPIVIVKDFIVLQFAAILAYLVLAIAGNYEFIYETRLAFTNQLFSYEIAKFIFLSLAEIILVGYIFLKWLFETFTVYKDYIAHEQGVFLKKSSIIPLNESVLIKVSYTPISKLLKYGTILIEDKKSKKLFYLICIINPESYVHLILNQIHEQVFEETIKNEDDLIKILKTNEHEKLEFKSSFRWDIRENKLNRAIEYVIMKTVAAFLNTKGGHLILGVDNDRKIIGLEFDYRSLPRKNSDSFENHFTNVFREVIGAEHRIFVQLLFFTIDDKEICVVRVLPSDKPVYLKSEHGEFFCIRTGNSTSTLKLSEVTPYIQSRWQK